jgi:hypothetical protein
MHLVFYCFSLRVSMKKNSAAIVAKHENGIAGTGARAPHLPLDHFPALFLIWFGSKIAA